MHQKIYGAITIHMDSVCPYWQLSFAMAQWDGSALNQSTLNHGNFYFLVDNL